MEEKKEKLEYYRELLTQNPTPLEAFYLSEYRKERLETLYVQKNMMTATILSLCKKKKIELNMEARKKVKITFKSNDTFDLDDSEFNIYELLKEISGKNKEIEIERLRDICKDNAIFYTESINRFVDEIIDDLYKRKLIDKNKERKYKKYSRIDEKGILFRYIYRLFGIKNKDEIEVLTDKGKKEKEKWKNLKMYIQNTYLLDEKDMKDFAICENYLIYATVFGISDKIIKEFEKYYSKAFKDANWNDNEIKEKYPLIYYIYNPEHNRLWEDDNSINPVSIISKELEQAYYIAARKRYRHLYRSNIKYAKEFWIEREDD